MTCSIGGPSEVRETNRCITSFVFGTLFSDKLGLCFSSEIRMSTGLVWCLQNLFRNPHSFCVFIHNRRNLVDAWWLINCQHSIYVQGRRKEKGKWQMMQQLCLPCLFQEAFLEVSHQNSLLHYYWQESCAIGFPIVLSKYLCLPKFIC